MNAAFWCLLAASILFSMSSISSLITGLRLIRLGERMQACLRELTFERYRPRTYYYFVLQDRATGWHWYSKIAYWSPEDAAFAGFTVWTDLFKPAVKNVEVSVGTQRVDAWEMGSYMESHHDGKNMDSHYCAELGSRDAHEAGIRTVADLERLYQCWTRPMDGPLGLDGPFTQHTRHTPFDVVRGVLRDYYLDDVTVSWGAAISPQSGLG